MFQNKLCVFLHKAVLFIRCIPKSIAFNLYYLPFRQAIQLPVLVSHRVAIQGLHGKLLIKSNDLHFNMIRIGFHENSGFDQKRVRAVWDNEGTVIFEGTAYLGNGTSIVNTGKLTLGNNFQVSGNSRIVCREEMYFGSDSLISWDCLFMDADAHRIYDADGNHINPNRPVRIGSRVWFGARCVVTKGSVIPNGCIIAANSCIYKKFDIENTIIGGYPARILREGVTWSS